MGMDLFGIKPSSEKGIYYRSNVWYWNPLWTYVIVHHQSLLPGDSTEGFYNQGYELDEFQAFALGTELLADFHNGIIAAYQIEFNTMKSEADLLECEFCNGTGIRTDPIGVANGFLDRELDPAMQIIVGRQYGTCNACSGFGKRESNISSYVFDLENVRNFGLFSISSGGFSIW